MGRTGSHYDDRKRVELTARQRQVLDLIAAGRSNREIGEHLGISLDGAKFHVSEILGKLGFGRREDAAAYWRKRRGPLARTGRLMRAVVGAGFLKLGLGAAGIALVAVATTAAWVSWGPRDGTAASALVDALPTPTETPKQLTAADLDPVSPEFNPRSTIEWLGFVVVGEIVYSLSDRVQIDETGGLGIGSQFSAVRVNLDLEPPDMPFEPTDGQATFLPAGTPIYELAGYSPFFRLAVRVEDELWIYEADTAPDARIAGDILDIEGRVVRVRVKTLTTPEEVILDTGDEEFVQELVNLLLASPIQEPGGNDDSFPTYRIEFLLDDGTATVWNYRVAAGYLVREIHVPPEFRELLEDKIGAPLLE